MVRKLIGSDKLIEQTRHNAFNIDTVLLADFVKVPYRSKEVVDIGTGNGSLMLYLSDKTKAHITGIEIQEENAKLAQHNITMNHLDERLTVIHADVKKVDMKGVDCIVCNPPFFKVNEHTQKKLHPGEAIARHEIELTFEELVKSVSRMLKYGGYFYFIHRPDRISEIIATLEKHDLTVKRMRFVHPYVDGNAKHVLIAAMMHGDHGVILEKPFILYQDKNVYSEALEDIIKE